ncbi:histone-arginine methyltransferase CARM1-like isoform X3 [Mauremys mutica]|uniref:histone-arginine methyltransferase CARM1-like isoform X3 n=1 Tax=Mauremys mutica TaxID=74926 RepID=UPI001D1606F7|nr:histone-arginine methyltransferase CARM1-like isoform X3 [Mauremys mutica]
MPERAGRCLKCGTCLSVKPTRRLSLFLSSLARCAGPGKQQQQQPPELRGWAAAGIMAAPQQHQLLQYSVKLLLVSEEQLRGGLQLASPNQGALQLAVQPGEEDADVTVTDEYSTFSNALKRCRNQKKEHSVFNQRTEEASAAQYFQFYGCLSQQQNMMQDFVRTATYHRAILQNHIDFKDKVVLDVGCGSGILSFFAVQAGARKVYAVEASSVAKYAEILVRSNNLSDKIMVLSGKIEEISLPENVDVVISEPMGYMLFNERMLESYLHSKKWLKSNGMMFPTFSDIHLAPFSDEQLYMEHYSRANFWYQQCFYGVNLSSLRSAAVDEYFRQPIVDTFDIRILMARTVKYTVNFTEAEEEDLHRVEIPFVFQMMQSGLIHGLAFWFDVAFVGSLVTVWLSTAPTEPLTHWYQVRCLLQTPLFAKEGETLSGKVLFVANKRQSYDIQIVAVVDQTGFKSGNILDLKNPFFRYA